ncbi:chea signal transduction histidine kinase, putative [Heliomicrobium modesticaldum Ice1]|uniref:histidine kinase n=2 Tax=Heliomicrobium modesticaldum TaxID=35701 RepID=B0TBE2_HELMI|nr:chea signal transduction histidine kinase, putative [Heliomicrobium modesticaldum Ice1]
MVELSKRREKQIRLLEKQKETIKNLMDNAGQGFLSFGNDLVIFNEYSLECVDIFEREIGGLNFLELIGCHLSQEERETTDAVLKGIFNANNSLERNVYISLLPSEIKVAEKIIQCEYKVIPQLEQKIVMAILTDITEKKALEQKMIEEKNNLKMVLKALSCQSDIINGMDGFKELMEKTVPEILESGYSPAEKLSEIYRAVHTYKGDFSQLHLSHTAAHLHELEDRLSLLTDSGNVTVEAIKEIVDSVDCEHYLARDREIITEILGEDFFCQSQTFAVSLDRIIEIEQRVTAAFSDEQQAELLSLIRRLRCSNFKDILAPYGEYVQSLAERLEKGIKPIEISGDDIFIDKRAYTKFCKSLIHVFRNVVDHGIEDMDSRIEAGKPEYGTIRVEVKAESEGFTLVIADDGKGIDPAVIKAKALEKGIYSEEAIDGLSDKEVIEIIFMDRFSTKDEVSIVSGRGVGMAAVRAEVESLGGSVEVCSEVGKGTAFIFRLPRIIT